MTKAIFAALATTGMAALLSGCAADGSAPNAMSAAQPTAAVETAAATAMPMRIDNFMLPDADYMGHELYREAGDAKVVVLITQMNNCPIVRNLAPALKALEAKYGPQGVKFIMLNSAVQDSPGGDPQGGRRVRDRHPDPEGLQPAGRRAAGRAAHRRVLRDRSEDLEGRLPRPAGRPARLRHPEGVRRASWATDAIEAVLAGRPAVAATKPTPGCLIDFPERGKVAKISYAKEVAPILEKKCASCHTAGGIGPFQMSSYEMVKGFSPMIREVIRTNRMPPWAVDPHVSKWADDKSLTARPKPRP
jgi:hypothetical protein